MRLKNSLLSKYVLIILLAIVLLPFSFPLMSVLFYIIPAQFENGGNTAQYRSGIELEDQWHAAARELAGASPEQIDNKLRELHRLYRGSSIFWVDKEGRARLKLSVTEPIPEQWGVADTIVFMKESYDADPFTVVAFIGTTQSEGFMVLQLDRSVMNEVSSRLSDRHNFLIMIGTLAIFAAFLFVSLIFFYRIRKRLLRLQQAMTGPSGNGIPAPIQVGKSDEIGRLEQAFNAMIVKLEEGRRREQEEERLRRQLIANLSHDLRTPLTTIRGHAYRLKKEALSGKGQASIDLIDRKIDYLGRLIENLLSFTLLASGKYPYRPARTDIVRLVRTLFAGWYPLFEKEQFDIDLELPEQPVYWHIDPQWFERVLDNLLQNVLRHASSGRYIGIGIKQLDNGISELTIADLGPGIDALSAGKGAGIGLSIVSLMLDEMQLKRQVSSSLSGTVIRILNKV